MDSNFSSLDVHKKCMKIISFFIFLIISFRYPFDEAATIAISTVKESSNDFKEEREREGDG